MKEIQLNKGVVGVANVTRTAKSIIRRKVRGCRDPRITFKISPAYGFHGRRYRCEMFDPVVDVIFTAYYQITSRAAIFRHHRRLQNRPLFPYKREYEFYFE